MDLSSAGAGRVDAYRCRTVSAHAASELRRRARGIRRRRASRPRVRHRRDRPVEFRRLDSGKNPCRRTSARSAPTLKQTARIIRASEKWAESVIYNRAASMRRTRMPLRLPVSVRPLVVILLGVCLAITDSSRTSAQQSDARPFPANAWAAIAHGKLADAEALARSQSSDPEAAAVLGHLAIRKGQYEEADKLLAPAAAQAPLSSAALELGLLHQRLGRQEAGNRLLTFIYRQASSAGNADALARAARAAQALGRPQEANSLFRTATGASDSDPAIETFWGQLLFERSAEADAQRSYEQALKLDPQWAPAHAGLGWAVSDVNPPLAAAAATKALEIDPGLDAAHMLLAQLDLDNSRPDAARA